MKSMKCHWGWDTRLSVQSSSCFTVNYRFTGSLLDGIVWQLSALPVTWVTLAYGLGITSLIISQGACFINGASNSVCNLLTTEPGSGELYIVNPLNHSLPCNDDHHNFEQTFCTEHLQNFKKLFSAKMESDLFCFIFAWPILGRKSQDRPASSFYHEHSYSFTSTLNSWICIYSLTMSSIMIISQISR